MKRILILSFLILLFSFWLASPAEAANASLYLLPSSGVYSVGNTFSIAVRVNTGGTSINATEGGLIFSPDKLEVISLSKTGSIFNLWPAEPVFSNSVGTISFGGGVPNPGYSGAAGEIITITFRAKISGTVLVSFSSGAVLANDGKGTNILSSLGNGNYTLQVGTITSPAPLPLPSGVPYPPEIISLTHPDSNKWHSNNSPKFEWNLPSDVIGVSIMLNDKPNSNPGPNSDGLFDSKTYEDLEDGIYYLHLKLKNQIGWSQISNFKVQIDTQPPKPFEIIVEDGTETYNPQPTLYFETTDDISGISHYEVKINNNNFIKTEKEKVEHNPYQMPIQAPGKHTVVIKAIDEAGNSTLAMAAIDILPIESPIITDYPETLMPDDILAFKGTALSESTVMVYVQQRGEEESIQEVKSNKDGYWSYVYDQPLERGIYRIWAKTIDNRGAQSLFSDKITIKISKPIFLRIGELIIEHLTIVISILTFLALFIVIFLYFWLKVKIFLKKLNKEAKEAEQALHMTFDALRDGAEDEFKLLDKVKSKRELTKEEKRIRKSLKKNLNIAEKYIEKEIADITDIKNQFNIKKWIRGFFK